MRPPIALHAAVALAAFSPTALAQPFTIGWYSIDAGGGVSTGGDFELRGVIGQPDAGPTLAGGDFELDGGFLVIMSVSCPADITGNGVVDADDFFAYLDLFAAGDPRADLDGNGVIDSEDFFLYLDFFVLGCP